MKKILIMLSLIVLASCSKNKSDEAVVAAPTNPAIVAEEKLSFKIAPQPHDGGFANFQAGEIIGYDVEITDPKSDIGATYELTPIGDSQSEHQILNTDYIFGDVNLTQTTNTSSTGLIYDSKKSAFKIKILKSGSFYLKFSLQKMVGGQKIGNPVINNQVIFSAVKFYLYVDSGNIGNRWDRDFFFNVDFGDQSTDNYFSDPNFTYTYTTSYCVDGGGFIGNLEKSKNLFSPSRRAGSGNAMYDNGLASITCNGHNGYILDEIAITYKSKNNAINGVIRYKNIPVNKDNKVL
jgi:hypothetical protein